MRPILDVFATVLATTFALQIASVTGRAGRCSGSLSCLRPRLSGPIRRAIRRGGEGLSYPRGASLKAAWAAAFRPPASGHYSGQCTSVSLPQPGNRCPASSCPQVRDFRACMAVGRMTDRNFGMPGRVFVEDRAKRSVRGWPARANDDRNSAGVMTGFSGYNTVPAAKIARRSGRQDHLS